MELNLSRFCSDRLLFDLQAPDVLRIANSFSDWCKRILSWVCDIPSYSEENKRALRCFKKYVSDVLGQCRFQRICHRYGLDFDLIEKRGGPLLSRDVAKIVIGSQDVRVQDIEGFEKLSCSELSQKVQRLSSLLPWKVPLVAGAISGAPTEWISSFFYDPFLADRERIQICKKHPRNLMDVFIHNLVARVVKREMDVGTLIQAPSENDRERFYYVAAKIVTGEGMVSYILNPAGTDNGCSSMRLFRGTSPRSSDLDAISGVIADMETDLGRSAYESGLAYEEKIKQTIGQPSIEAGHSLGSTIVQYRLANMDHIKKAYLFCGPGLPVEEVEKFNRKMSIPGAEIPEMLIRHTSSDHLSLTGKLHLGHGISADIDYKKYHPPVAKHGNPHVYVYGKGNIRFGIEGGFNFEQRNRQLSNQERKIEKIRSLFGPYLAAILKVIRFVSRSLFQSRAEDLKGVHIGVFKKGCFQVEHFR